MIILSNQIVSITEANQNFNQVLKKTQEHGDIVIFKRNKPAYIMIDIESVGAKFIEEYELLKQKYMNKEAKDVER